MGQKSYGQVLSEVLAMMASALKGASGDQASLAQAWMLVMSGKVEQEWLVPTCEWFLNNATFFPVPAEFIRRAAELKETARVHARLEASKVELKAQDDARISALREKYPNIDKAFVDELWSRPVFGISLAAIVQAPDEVKALPMGSHDLEHHELKV